MDGSRAGGGAGAFVSEYIAKTRQFSRNANLYVLHVVGMDMIHGSWTVLFNLYLLAIGFDIRFIGLRLIIEGIARAITAVPAGLVSDRIGRKASFILGDGVGAVVGLVQISTQSEGILLAGRRSGRSSATCTTPPNRRSWPRTAAARSACTSSPSPVACAPSRRWAGH